MKALKWLCLFSLILILGREVYAQGTQHQASYSVSSTITGTTSINCYKSTTGATGSWGTAFANVSGTSGTCTDTNVGAQGTMTFYTATALVGTDESGIGNVVSGVAVGVNPPTVGAVTEQ